jgi:hypothetical protein
MKLLRAWLLVVVTTGRLAGAEQDPDWWKSQRDLTAWLWDSNTPMATVVRTVNAQPAADGPAAMFKVCLLLRAGMNEQAVGALRELKAACPKLGGGQVNNLYYDACDHEAAWEVAQAVAEVFAEDATDLTLENRLLKHWLESGWTVEKVDAWLAARPPGIHSFWVKERLRFAQSHGRGEALLQQLSDGVRRNPSNVTTAVVFLDALLYARQGAKPIDLSWLEGVVKPVRALDAKAMADRLQQLANWNLALVYGQQAITTPLTDPEVRELGRMRQLVLPAEKLRAEFEANAREAVAECLLNLGRTDAAQLRMVEAADLRERNGLRGNPLLAGRVQAESGQRTIERRIVEAEKKSDQEPEYWRERAQYFRGRKEADREEAALKQGLSLTKPQSPPDRPGKGHADWRSWLLSDYARFLAGHGRESEAVALLRQELAEAPAVAESSVRAASLLAFDFSKQVSAEDAVLWNWLANRPAWAYPEERLLWRMLENAPKETLDRHFTRAEKLAAGGDPNRAHTLGWIMNRLQFPKRSLPLLKHAVATAHDEELKQRAAFALLESFLDTGNWKDAEAIFPEAARRLTAQEIPQWHSRLALAAARDGAKADALRLWFRTANVSPTATGGLAELARLGLREDLVAFYQAMQKEMPASRAPDRALKLLQGT